MEFENIVFFQGDDATNILDLIGESGENAAMAHLFATYVGEIEPEEAKTQYPWGEEDNVFIREDYIMSYNFKVGYVGLCFFSGLDIKEPDISWESGYFSYMMKYKHFDIGGGGSDKRGKKLHSNLDHYNNYGRITKRDILDSRIRPDMLRSIMEIESRLTENK